MYFFVISCQLASNESKYFGEKLIAFPSTNILFSYIIFRDCVTYFGKNKIKIMSGEGLALDSKKIKYTTLLN
jgi:hypothetical protein